MLETKELFIPNRQRFSDLREHSENNKKTISEARNTFRTVPAYRNRRIFRECEDRQMQIWNQAVSCWTYDSHRVSENSEELDENYVMWASHIIKKSVCRIRSTIKRFSSSIINLSHDIIISDVKYKPVARRHFANISEDIFIKPDFYMDEDEIRFVVLQNERFASDNQNDVVLSINPFELIDEITISPFISREEEQILAGKLRRIIGDNQIRIKQSIIMENKKD